MKYCPRCTTDKPDTEFAWKNRQAGTLASYCRPCQAGFRRSHHAKNGAVQRAKVKERREGLEAFIQDVRDGGACSKCGEGHPATLDFHHRDRTAKEVAISKISRQGWSLSRIKEEIAKCVILCANCHRKEHWAG